MVSWLTEYSDSPGSIDCYPVNGGATLDTGIGSSQTDIVKTGDQVVFVGVLTRRLCSASDIPGVHEVSD